MWHYLRDPICLAVLIQYRSVTDTHTHTEMDRHTTTAYTTLSIASRGKNRHIARIPQSITTMQATSVG